MSAVSWLSRLVKDGVIIAPSLLAANFAELGKEIHKLEEGGAQILHLDVMDGAYVPNISFGTPIISSIRKITPLKFDVHLMIEKPERYIERFCPLGADSLTVHVETVQDPAGVLAMIRDYGVAAGRIVSGLWLFLRVLVAKRLGMIHWKRSDDYEITLGQELLLRLTEELTVRRLLWLLRRALIFLLLAQASFAQMIMVNKWIF